MPGLTRLAVTLLTAAIIGSVAHAGARLTWRASGLSAAPLPPVVVAQAVAAPLDIGPILALAPFGERILAPVAPRPAPGGEPQDDWLLDLTLEGVIVAEPATRSLAMIAVGSEGVRTVGVGETPFRGVTVKEVRKQGVLFTAGEKDVFLGFESEEDRRTASLDRQRSLIPEKFRGTPANGAAGSPGRSVDAAIDYYRQQIAANPQTVLDTFGVRLTGGGYEIGPTPSIGVTRAGLRPGDVIRSVNGERVGDIEADRRLYEKIAAAGHARVEILRGGRRVILSFPLR